MRKKYGFILELSFYSVCFITFLIMRLFSEVPRDIANIIYIVFISISFGYLIILGFWGIKDDPAVHCKQLEKNFKGKAIKTDKTYKKNKRGKIKNVIILWVVYLFIVGVLRYSNIVDWEIFLCGVCVLLGLNSYFCRLNCWLSKGFLKKSGCCMDCGINGWDLAIFASALIFSPYLSVEAHLLDVTIIVISFVKLAMWEYRYRKHQYRFHKETNKKLNCQNCMKNCRHIKRVK